MTTETDKTLKELNELLELLTNIEKSIDNNNDIDMTGIDDRINKVCIDIQDSSKEQQEKYLPALNELLNKLNICEVAINAIKDK